MWKVADWQDMFTEFDVDNLFENFVTELSYNELAYLDASKAIQIEAIPSGSRIGEANWIIKVLGADATPNGQQKIGLMNNVCLEGNYRYPRLVDIKSLMDCDAIVCGSRFLETATAEQNKLG